MKANVIKGLIISLILVMILALAGCGGSDVSSTTGGTSVPTDTTPAATGFGTYSVTINTPAADNKELSASYIPGGSDTLRVTLTGEVITQDMIVTKEIAGPGPHTLTVENVPVGLGIANIEILRDGTIVAQRKHGFYMIAGGNVGPGTLDMGIVIGAGGVCYPSTMEIPSGTTLYFENQDYDADHTVSFNNGAVVLGPIARVQPASQPNTAAVFSALSYTFNTPGTYTYDTGMGAPGSITVYIGPNVTAIDPNHGDIEELNFTVTGQNFTNTQTAVNGQVIFTRVDDPNDISVVTATISSWSDTTITGTAVLPGYKYLVQVIVRGTYSPDAVYYYRARFSTIGDPRVSVGNAKDLSAFIHSKDTEGAPYMAYLDGMNAGYNPVYSEYNSANNVWTQYPYDWSPSCVNARLQLLENGTGVHKVGALLIAQPATVITLPDTTEIAIPSYNALYYVFDGNYARVSPYPQIDYIDSAWRITQLWDVAIDEASVKNFAIAIDNNENVKIAYAAAIPPGGIYQCFAATVTGSGTVLAPVPVLPNVAGWVRDGATAPEPITADAISPLAVKNVSLTVDDAGNFYLAYGDNSNLDGATVMVTPPTTVFSDQWAGAGTQVYYPNSVTGPWALVGKPGFTLGAASAMDITVDTTALISGNYATPLLALRDSGSGLSLRRFTNTYTGDTTTGWLSVGAISGSATTDISIDVYHKVTTGAPVYYVSYSDAKGNLIRYDTEQPDQGWAQVGTAGFSLGTADYLSLFVFPTATGPIPYVGYTDSSYNQKATMQKFGAGD